MSKSIRKTTFGHATLILRGDDAYLGGKGSLEITGLLSVSDRGEKIDQGEVLALWGEALYAPSALVLDPRARWETIDTTSARLIVPFGDREESLRAEFDPETGLMKRMSGMRYRGQEETKPPGAASIRSGGRFTG